MIFVVCIKDNVKTREVKEERTSEREEENNPPHTSSLFFLFFNCFLLHVKCKMGHQCLDIKIKPNFTVRGFLWW